MKPYKAHDADPELQPNHREHASDMSSIDAGTEDIVAAALRARRKFDWVVVPFVTMFCVSILNLVLA